MMLLKYSGWLAESYPDLAVKVIFWAVSLLIRPALVFFANLAEVLSVLGR
jgi:hypothetical protein